jgi:hypothetical protein
MMTNKIQISKKYADGTIFVIGGETPDEFNHNYQEMISFMEGLDSTLPAETQTESGPGGTFAVENIKLASGGEHPRWVVQGGNFKKYGVTCWPETLKEAGILEKLDPMKDNPPSGNWIAHYIKKVDGSPDKVVKLVRE